MLLAAAACAAAGITYIFNDDGDDEQTPTTSYEAVTVSSTIVDQQGIVKYIFQPQWRSPCLFVNQQQKGTSSFINECKLNRYRVPTETSRQAAKSIFARNLSVLFFWSMPLRARLVQTGMKPSQVVEELNSFKPNLMKLSVGIQNVNSDAGRSEIVLAAEQRPNFLISNDTFDSLSYNSTKDDDLVPCEVLKKNKLSVNDRNNSQKRFCSEELNKKNCIRKTIFNNVNQCVENLSKILSESCSNDESHFTTLENSSSVIRSINSNNNHKQNTTSMESSNEPIPSFLPKFKHQNTTLIEEVSDGIILHRGEHFGVSLGKPMIRRCNSHVNYCKDDFHSIYQLNRLLSNSTCLLMQQYHIESIEDLIRLYLEHGSHHFTELLIKLFKVDSLIVQELTDILLEWTNKLT
ncbi:unnamed protein product [Adineta ricciae]|uniref:Uncharacterized protein n=1 Tax=Adineta ricciae TaxID=249248 RepID=A0A814N1R3_ADIRI|nr:unnamed protein product [Adineta ricciae]CAF1086700.1 unnamed protein product [Adineta ricciae]